MSLTSALLAGVSGLDANTSALSAISQNIANVDTVGYKGVETDFNDLITQASDVGNYSAGGVSSVTVQNVAQQGATTQTSSPYDLAVNGQGMFVTTQSPTVIDASTQVLYTRAGSFTPNSNGYLQNAAGLYLQAYPTNANGIVVNNSSLEGLQPVNVTDIAGAISQTTAVSINANLASGTAVSTAATDAGLVAAGTATAAQTAVAYSPTSASTSMAAYANGVTTGTKPDFSSDVLVSDSQGSPQTLQYSFLKSSTPNQWYVEVIANPASSVQTPAGVPAGQIASGIVAFNSDSSLNTSATTLPTSLTIGASSSTPGAGQVSWASSLGVAGQTIAVNLSPTTSTGVTTNGLTQNSNSSGIGTGGITANGSAYGNVSSVAVNTSGLITATFSNGNTRTIGQVAVATFPNVDGLTATSGEAYLTSAKSGAVNLQTPGTGGAGTIASSALESSTVDLSSEFANLIVTQRAYTASSKILTTADSMTQDLLSIIR